MTCARFCDWRRGAQPSRPQRSIDSRTLRSTPESGERGGYDGGKALLVYCWQDRRRCDALIPRDAGS